jgi:myo-inositol-1(or 4)-monophosphatase
MELVNICEKACTAAKEAGLFIQSQINQIQRTDIEEKGLNQLVSYVDKTSEEMLVRSLKAILPNAGFITEEETVAREQAEYTWIIDPLDGTTNFLHALPVYSVSVALMQNNQLVVGIVYEPNRDELFYAWSGGGAYLNGKRIHVKTNNELNKSLLATGFPYYDFKRVPQYLATLSDLMKGTHGMRRMGSAAVDLAYTACGRFDGFFEYGLSPWDVAGGIVLIREAGGKISDFDGADDYLFGKTIIGASEAVYDQLLGVIQRNFQSN